MTEPTEPTINQIENRLFLLNLTDSEKYERKKAQDRARQRAYYNRNKEVFTAKKREATVQIRQVRQANNPQAEDEMTDQGNDPYEPDNRQLDFGDEPIAPAEPERVDVPVPIRKQTAKSKLKGKTYAQILTAWKGDGEHTLKTNTTQLNGLYELLDKTPHTQVLDLHHAEYVIAVILNRRKNNGKQYAVASNVKLLQVLLKLVSPSDKTPPLVPIPADQVLLYKHKHDALDATVRGQTEAKKQSEAIGEWGALVSQVLAKEGAHSKAYVYLRLYDLLKCRDDMQLMTVKTVAEAQDTTKNYIVIPETAGQSGLVLLNRFKTDKGFDKKRVVIPAEIVQLVKSYGYYKGYGQYLFGSGKQANFVGSLLKKYHMKLQGGGIDLLRKILRAKYMKHITTFDEEARLAHEFGHTLKTAQAVYARVAPVAPAPAPVAPVVAQELIPVYTGEASRERTKTARAKTPKHNKTTKGTPEPKVVRITRGQAKASAVKEVEAINHRPMTDKEMADWEKETRLEVIRRKQAVQAQEAKEDAERRRLELEQDKQKQAVYEEGLERLLRSQAQSRKQDETILKLSRMTPAERADWIKKHRKQ